MQLKSFLLVFGLLLISPLMASPTPFAASHENNPHSLSSCDIPAPNNFHPTFTGPTWAILEWDFQTNALDGYRVRTYKASNNALVDTQIVPQNVTTITVNGLVSGEEYYSVINSRCAGGENSIDTATSETYRVLIIDLVVNGYEGTNSVEDCLVNANVTCKFPLAPGESASFKIKHTDTGEIRRFEIKRKMDGDFFECQLKNSNAQEKFLFFCDDQVPALPKCPTNLIHVFYDNGIFLNPVTDFSVSASTNYVEIKCISMNNAEIWRLLGTSAPGSGRSDTPANTNYADALAQVSPNPFDTQLDVSLSSGETQGADFRLFNLNGQCVMRQQIKAGQTQVSLPTSHLLPGFYLLQIKTGDKTQTFKVMKTE